MKYLKQLLAMAVLSLGMSSANAALISYDISVSGDWFDKDGTPFNMPLSPSLTGLITVDNAFSGLASLVSFSLTTGDKTWNETQRDPGITPGFINIFGGELTFFALAFSDADSGMIIATNNTFNTWDGATNTGNFCNNCVSFQRSTGSPNGQIPEPASIAILSLGLGLLTLRRKVR